MTSNLSRTISKLKPQAFFDTKFTFFIHLKLSSKIGLSLKRLTFIGSGGGHSLAGMIFVQFTPLDCER